MYKSITHMTILPSGGMPHCRKMLLIIFSGESHASSTDMDQRPKRSRPCGNARANPTPWSVGAWLRLIPFDTNPIDTPTSIFLAQGLAPRLTAVDRYRSSSPDSVDQTVRWLDSRNPSTNHLPDGILPSTGEDGFVLGCVPYPVRNGGHWRQVHLWYATVVSVIHMVIPQHRPQILITSDGSSSKEGSGHGSCYLHKNAPIRLVGLTRRHERERENLIRPWYARSSMDLTYIGIYTVK